MSSQTPPKMMDLMRPIVSFHYMINGDLTVLSMKPLKSIHSVNYDVRVEERIVTVLNGLSWTDTISRTAKSITARLSWSCRHLWMF